MNVINVHGEKVKITIQVFGRTDQREEMIKPKSWQWLDSALWRLFNNYRLL